MAYRHTWTRSRAAGDGIPAYLDVQLPRPTDGSQTRLGPAAGGASRSMLPARLNRDEPPSCAEWRVIRLRIHWSLPSHYRLHTARPIVMHTASVAHHAQ
jgi:hypothetical protein